MNSRSQILQSHLSILFVVGEFALDTTADAGPHSLLAYNTENNTVRKLIRMENNIIYDPILN